MVWTRISFDFPPVWRGASLMSFAHQGFQRRQPAGIAEWVLRARDPEAVGFAPAEYEVLLLCLGVLTEPVAAYPAAKAVYPFEPVLAADWLNGRAVSRCREALEDVARVCRHTETSCCA